MCMDVISFQVYSTYLFETSSVPKYIITYSIFISDLRVLGTQIVNYISCLKEKTNEGYRFGTLPVAIELVLLSDDS